jgi:ankyrin repeat protein
MFQVFKKTTILNSMCLILALFQVTTLQSSSPDDESTRTHEFFEELAKNADEIDYDNLVALIKKGIDLADTRNHQTPLIKAVYLLNDHSNGKKVIKALIDQILEKNEPLLYSEDDYGNTPLSIAAQLRKHGFYELLYRVYTYEQHEIANNRGFSAIDYKNLTNRTDSFFDLFKNNLESITPKIHHEFQDLIQRGIDFNYHQGDLQETPLTLAVKHLPDNAIGLSIVKNLLDEGAYYDSTDAFGNSALSIAVQRNKPNFAQLLLRFGASQSMRNMDNKRPIDYALESRNEQLKNLFEPQASQPRPQASQQPKQSQAAPQPKEDTRRIAIYDPAVINALHYFNIDPDNLTVSDLAKVKSDYKKLSLRLHPDRNQKSPTATKDFQKLGENYDALRPLLEKFNLIS